MTYNVRKDGCVRRRASHCRRVAWRFSIQKGTDDGSFKRIRNGLSGQKKGDRRQENMFPYVCLLSFICRMTQARRRASSRQACHFTTTLRTVPSDSLSMLMPLTALSSLRPLRS